MAEPGAKTHVIVNKGSGPNIIIRALWFIFIGWWLGQIMLILAWILNILIITLPLGLYIINRLPQIFTLRGSSQTIRYSTTDEGTSVAQVSPVKQRSFLLRAAYFLCVGWWFSLIWMEVAWLVAVIGVITIVLAPAALSVSFLMFSKSAAITTLRRT